MKARRTLIIGLIAVVALALALPAVSVCRDWAFIDRNTGSRKGYREWFLGWRTGSWSQESVIEAYMRASHPGEFRQDWVSYAGTGRNVFGGATSYGHGRPGPIAKLRPEAIANHCRTASAAEMRRLYDGLASGDESRIRGLVDDISKAELASEGRVPDGASDRSQPVRAGTNRASVPVGSDR